MEKKVINQEVSNATTTAAFAMAMKLLNKIKETKILQIGQKLRVR
jgi:hypothetical protein